MTEQEIEAIAQRIFDESSERTRLGRAKCVAASVIHRMEKYGEHTDPDMVWSPPSASWPSSSKASGGGKGTD